MWSSYIDFRLFLLRTIAVDLEKGQTHCLVATLLSVGLGAWFG